MLIIQAVMIMVVILIGLAGCIWMVRIHWRSYGLLYLISSLSGNLFCYMLTFAGFYSFPNNVLHWGLLIPYLLVSTAFPFLVLASVRYGPSRWVWKIPFYWAIIHLGVLGEVILLYSDIFEFSPEWDLWDSYTLWWIYYLLFDLLGNKIVPASYRKPLDADWLRYGRAGWIIIHVIYVITIFLAGVYFGVTIIK